MPKTGTTDLQYRLNRTPGQDPRPFLTALPADLIAPALERRIHILHRILTLPHDPRAANLLDRLVGWLEEGEGTARILCSELLSQTPHFGQGWTRHVFARLAEVAEIRIVLVLRPYFSWMESFINQHAKTGRCDLSALNDAPSRSFAAWETNYLRLIDFYASCLPAGHDAPNVQPFVPGVNEEIAALAGVELAPPNTGRTNSSASAHTALCRYAAHKDIAAENLPKESDLQFIGPRQVAAWRPLIADWVDPLAERLGWPRDWLDDGDRVLDRGAQTSYIDLLSGARPQSRTRRPTTPSPDGRDTGRAISTDRAQPISTLQQSTERPAMAETVEHSEDQKTIYSVSRILARNTLIDAGNAEVGRDAVNEEWQRDKASYQNKAIRLLRSLDRAGYTLTPKAE